jgi:hypothetical protein
MRAYTYRITWQAGDSESDVGGVDQTLRTVVLNRLAHPTGAQIDRVFEKGNPRLDWPDLAHLNDFTTLF